MTNKEGIMNKVGTKNVELEYIHSSNSVFHFMKSFSYLETALRKKGLSPRYCEEKIDYLGLTDTSQYSINTISVLQKCFCDIPIHCIAKRLPVKEMNVINDFGEGAENELNMGSTHTDFYGEYSISFSKIWAKKNDLLPVHYISEESSYREEIKKYFEFILKQEDVEDLIVSDVIWRMAYYKPLEGEITRNIDGNRIRVWKNFHDECEWRYVPKEEKLEQFHISPIVFDKETLRLTNSISDRLLDDKYKDIWLNFEYQDIQYLIVPDFAARNKLIDLIKELEIDSNDVEQEKYLLISKILILENIKRDF